LSNNVNGGAAVAVDRVENFSVCGVIDGNDLTLFHANNGQGVNLGDVILLSADTFFMVLKVSVPPSPTGSTKRFSRSFGNQLGTGTTGGTIAGDYNLNSVVDTADYVAWRKALGTTFTQANY
jgi:hypothetical protein